MRVRRRLTAIGAVPVKNSVYALPASETAREDFEWLFREIVEDGGEATLCEAVFLDDRTDERLRGELIADRNAAYAAIRDEAEAAAGEAGGSAVLRALRRRLEEAIARDAFGAPARHEAENAVAALEARLSNDRKESQMNVEGRTIEGISGRTWVTRRGAKVDRIASSWLIRRFIDPSAELRFVDPETHVPAAGELRFDMFGGEYTHAGEMCTFETLVDRFGLADPALRAIAEIVHDIDLKEDRFGRPETAGVASLIDGIAAGHPHDEERIRRGAEFLDDLYTHFRGAPA
ncbi:MAG TPA: chromate resistance protein ChrB domain-containing protein [Gemmatimonadota bacterium]|nr:chromate resistance protein ChrB domain-containing protein [Gemmatimonadota bacterium]